MNRNNNVTLMKEMGVEKNCLSSIGDMNKGRNMGRIYLITRCELQLRGLVYIKMPTALHELPAITPLSIDIAKLLD